MDSISKERVYRDFEPTWDWVPDEDCDTLLLHLPGELPTIISLINPRG